MAAMHWGSEVESHDAWRNSMGKYEEPYNICWPELMRDMVIFLGDPGLPCVSMSIPSALPHPGPALPHGSSCTRQ
eukprot:9096377-Prorocentrum_lima.AAC.1